MGCSVGLSSPVQWLVDLKFLLLDEPTAGLNRTESDELVHIIRAIRDRYSCGVLLVDHDLRVIMSACSRVVVLNEGKIISQGQPEQVRRDPAVNTCIPRIGRTLYDPHYSTSARSREC